MKAKLIFLLLIFFGGIINPILAQPSAEEQIVIKAIADIDQKIDRSVVSKDIPVLQQLYADDFVFTHGSGHVDSKASWIKDIQNPDRKFISREHDSTQVELHNNIAIVHGRMLISREDKNGTVKYGIWYIRVYALRKNNWQLISHRTTKEWHY